MMLFKLLKGPFVKIIKTLIGLTAIAAFSSAMADEIGSPSSWYVGVGMGQSNVSFNSTDFHVNPAIIAAGYAANEYQTTSDTSYDVYAGYRFTENLSAKIEYSNFGKQVYGSNASGSGGTGNANSNIYIQSIALGAVGTYPIYKQFSVLGELGAMYYSGTRNPTHSGVYTSLTGTPSNSSGSDLNPYAAIGLQYDFSKQISVIGKYSYYGVVGKSNNIGQIALSNVGLNLQFNF